MNRLLAGFVPHGHPEHFERLKVVADPAEVEREFRYLAAVLTRK